jgi:kinesin family protein 11
MAPHKRDIRRQPKTSQSRNTTHGKDASLPTIPKNIQQESGDKTAIYVTVRCRGRNEQETVEDRAVILQTDGIKGQTVEVSTGSLSNKSYNFDRVFPSAADQRTIYEDTVLPIVDEVRIKATCL